MGCEDKEGGFDGGETEVGGEAGGGDGPEGMLSRGLAGVTAADDGEDTPGGSLVHRYIVICRSIDR